MGVEGRRHLTGSRSADRRFARALARAFGGAIVFSLPILMTMEMWSLGFSMPPLRQLALLLVLLPLLVGLSYFSGFEKTRGLFQAASDAFVALVVAAFASAVVLGLFGVLRPSMGLEEVVGKVLVQTLPGSIGALLARSQFGERAGETRQRRKAGALGEYFFMAAGALFLATNVAPTEEMELIAFQMSPWQALGLASLSLLAMHAFVYALEFRGSHAVPAGISPSSVFLRFTVTGYALALATSAFLLWCFGRLDSTALHEAVEVTVVLGVPSAVGAAAARLIL